MISTKKFKTWPWFDKALSAFSSDTLLVPIWFAEESGILFSGYFKYQSEHSSLPELAHWVSFTELTYWLSGIPRVLCRVKVTTLNALFK